MAVPTITSVTPNTGPPTGGQLIEIIGTNFRPQTTPVLTAGPTPAAPPSVRVLIGGVEVEKLIIVSETRLLAVTPNVKMPVVNLVTQGISTLDVTVENIDDAGVLIPGETVTLSPGYEYRRPDISTANESPLTNFVRQLLQTLKSETVPNVVHSVHTDYDNGPFVAATVEPAQVPAVVLIGPELEPNSFYTDNELNSVELVPGQTMRQRRALYFDLSFDLVVITQHDMALLNLIHLISVVIDRNSSFKFECPDPLEDIELEIFWETGLSVTKQTNQLNSNVRTARGTFRVVGFPFSTISGSVNDAVQDVVAQVTEEPTLQPAAQIGENLPTNQGASVSNPVTLKDC